MGFSAPGAPDSQAPGQVVFAGGMDIYGLDYRNEAATDAYNSVELGAGSRTQLVEKIQE